MLHAWRNTGITTVVIVPLDQAANKCRKPYAASNFISERLCYLHRCRIKRFFCFPWNTLVISSVRKTRYRTLHCTCDAHMMGPRGHESLNLLCEVTSFETKQPKAFLFGVNEFELTASFWTDLWKESFFCSYNCALNISMLKLEMS